MRLRSAPALWVCFAAACAPAAATLPVFEAERKPVRADREYDFDKDDKPEIFEFGAAAADGHFAVRRREIDLNHDGKIDVIRLYGPDEKLSREEFDLDYDGKIDVVSIYDRGLLVRQELDQNRDGRFEAVRYYERGKLVRREVDEHGRQKPNRFEFYEQGELDRVGLDRDGDGVIDLWEQKKSGPASDEVAK